MVMVLFIHLWGQAKNLFGPLASALEALNERSLRDSYVNDPRAIARLNSASGKVAGKWLAASLSHGGLNFMTRLLLWL